MAEQKENGAVRSAAGKWALLVLTLGLIVAWYVWLNGVPGATQASGPDAPARGDAPQSDAPRASASVPDPEPGQKKVVLEDLGMVCPLCRSAVASKLKKTPGVVSYEVDLGTDSATVLYDPDEVTIGELKRAIADAGYRVRGVREIRQ
jgi:copper chaperone CopZ